MLEQRRAAKRTPTLPRTTIKITLPGITQSGERGTAVDVFGTLKLYREVSASRVMDSTNIRTSAYTQPQQHRNTERKR